MIAQAKLHYLKISPRKVRLVVDLIRGKKVEEAQNLLRFTQKRATLPLLKLLNQALSNAANNNSVVNEDNIFISKIFVDVGPVAKRRFPRAKGKSDIIRKRTSHITIVLDEINKAVKDVTKSKKGKAVKDKAKIKKAKPSKKKVKKEDKSKKPRRVVSKRIKSIPKKDIIKKDFKHVS